MTLLQKIMIIDQIKKELEMYENNLELHKQLLEYIGQKSKREQIKNIDFTWIYKSGTH